MFLPGGYHDGQNLHRSYCLAPVTGYLESCIAEQAACSSLLPEKVTEILATALESIGSTAASREIVHNLVVGDRQFLMRQMDILLHGDKRWLTAVCSDCGEKFDIELILSQLPVQQAGAEFPFVSVDTAEGALSFQLPTGAMQISLAGHNDTRRLLTDCLVTDREDSKDCVDHLSMEEIAKIEKCMDATAPQIITMISSQCPSCGKTQELTISAYGILSHKSAAIFSEVHQIASHYHWSEADILSLQRSRRQRYLSLIDQNRGFKGAGDSQWDI